MRDTAIQDRLVQLFRDELGHTTVSVDRETWAKMPLLPRFRFGYMPPVPYTNEREKFVVSFCPELIDAVTETLDDDDLDTYLNAVEAFVAGHLMLPDTKSEDVMRHVEDQLLAEAPDALAFMTDVELRAIDAGIVG